MNNKVRDGRLVRPRLVNRAAKALGSWLDGKQVPARVRADVQESGHPAYVRRVITQPGPRLHPSVKVSDLIAQLNLDDETRPPLASIIVNGDYSTIDTVIPDRARIEVCRATADGVKVQ